MEDIAANQGILIGGLGEDVDIDISASTTVNVFILYFTQSTKERQVCWQKEDLNMGVSKYERPVGVKPKKLDLYVDNKRLSELIAEYHIPIPKYSKQYGRNYAKKYSSKKA